MKFLLDGVDITQDIMKQTNIPSTSGGVYPNMGTKWYNFFPIIQAHQSELGDFFSRGGLHSLQVVGDNGTTVFDVKMILRMCYSARNS